MPLWGNDADGNGEYELGAIYANDADGNGEYELGAIYANDADGNGEYPIWKARETIEDFEWAASESLTTYYSGDTDLYTVQGTTTLEGGYTLESTTEFGRLWWAANETTTPRGYEYYQDIQLTEQTTSSDFARLWFAAPTSHSSGAPSSGYYIEVYDSSDNSTSLAIFDAGGTQLASASPTINTGTHYIVGFRYDNTGVSGNLQAVLYDSDENEIASTSAVSDDTHTGGKHGWYANKAGVYIDFLRREEL